MKQILILDGWKVRREDEFNWLMSKGRRYLPIPRKSRTLTFAIMDQCLQEAGILGQKYFDLLKSAQSTPAVRDSDPLPPAVIQ
jgi:hypothetical protein